MKILSRILLTIAMAGVVVVGAFALRSCVEGRRAAKTKEPEKVQPFSPADLHLSISHCDVSAVGLSPLLKVYVSVGNSGKSFVRLGPGSFWLMDGAGNPYLDRNAAENPRAEPLTLQPGMDTEAIELKFRIPPSALAGSLTLVAGPAPTNVAGSGPPTEAARVFVKESGAPKGPFLKDKWHTYTGTQWR